ncbi:YcgN family cysteine cluster protein [Bowmanella sp. JS7-9]|uniref:YcgN family cysteine cluster protein n=1 Tax=Pseudobowmanella zhangzhouensis TaxID=1537679 RepID=A0ABW1XLH2_9ALTE|nr:YcgN family cysteine cluster protein [Bowmanella sp. JS7-9]TBX25725.1 hypothetical protein TK45_03275 [Bowmanella sp. JS7-9]
MTDRFWEQKSLDAMSREEWESICDGCGKCCLHKFIEDDDEAQEGPTDVIHDGEHIHYTNVVCGLLNTKTCSCTQYSKRTELVPDCVKLTKENLKDIFFMPPSCSYRRLHEGRGLPSWHPLLNRGKKTAMYKAGMSIRGRIISENDADLDNFEDYIVMWPLEDAD